MKEFGNIILVFASLIALIILVNTQGVISEWFALWEAKIKLRRIAVENEIKKLDPSEDEEEEEVLEYDKVLNNDDYYKGNH